MSTYVDLPLIRAVDYDGDLSGKEVTVNVPQYACEFCYAFKHLPFDLHDVFTVMSDRRLDNERWIKFKNDLGLPGWAPAERFFVLDP